MDRSGRGSREIAALRAEAIRKHRNATRKISRLRANRDVELAGTQFDPRRSLSKVRKYNSRQLKVYVAELEKFTSRDVSFVRGSKGRVLSGQLWKEYQKAERKLHAVFQSQFDRYKSLKLPNSDENIEQRMYKMRPQHRAMADLAVHSMFDPTKRSSRGMMSDEAIKRLTKETIAKTAPEYISKRVASEREQAAHMLDIVGDEELARKISDLSDEQFLVMFEYTGFAASLSLNYEIAMMATMKRQAWHDRIANDQLDNAREYARWASGLNLGG